MRTRTGIAPVVATIILVLIVIVAAGGAFTWINQIIQGQMDRADVERNREVTVRDIQCAPAAGPAGNTTIDYLLVNSGSIDMDNTVNTYMYNVSNGDLWGTSTGDPLQGGNPFAAGGQADSITTGSGSIIIQGATVQSGSPVNVQFEFTNDDGFTVSAQCDPS